MQDKKWGALPSYARTLLNRAAEEPLYFATPGHHAGNFFEETEAGRRFVEFFGKNLFRADLSDSDDAMGDAAAHEGASGEAERLAAKVWRADKTFFVLGGTSAANRAAMGALLAPGDLALIDRSSHKSIAQGLAKTGAAAVYLGGLRNGAGVIGGLSAECFDEKVLRGLAAEISPGKARARHPFRLACLQLVTYEGIFCSAKKILSTLGTLCDYILFDSAWGGYESFLPFMEEESPLTLPLSQTAPGLLVTQSVHKQLAGFSQTSQLHVKDAHLPEKERVPEEIFRAALASESSTSPFLPFFAGLEINAAIHEEKGREIWGRAVRFAVRLRKRIIASCRHIHPFQPEETGGRPWISYPTEEIAEGRQFWEIRPGESWHGFAGRIEGQSLLDPCKILLITDFPAEVLGKFLQERRIVPEKTDFHTLLLLAEPGDDEEKAASLVSALRDFENKLDKNSPIYEALPGLWKEFPARYGGLGLVELCDAQEAFFARENFSAKQHELFKRENFPKAGMTARDARDALVRGEGILVPLSELPGRIALEAACAYPPGICEVAAGEFWKEEAAAFFQTLLSFKNQFPGFGAELHGVHAAGEPGRLAGCAWVKA